MTSEENVESVEAVTLLMRQMMTLAGLASTAQEPRPSGESLEEQVKRMQSGIQAQLADRWLATVGAWTLLWVGLTKDRANMVYLPKDGRGGYAVVLRGTRFSSLLDINQDFDVKNQVYFQWSTGGKISKGAMDAFTEIVMGTDLITQLQRLQLRATDTLTWSVTASVARLPPRSASTSPASSLHAPCRRAPSPPPPQETQPLPRHFNSQRLPPVVAGIGTTSCRMPGQIWQRSRASFRRRGRPVALRLLGLPPGWRFLVADKYEDVWENPSLLKSRIRRRCCPWPLQRPARGTPDPAGARAAGRHGVPMAIIRASRPARRFASTLPYSRQNLSARTLFKVYVDALVHTAPIAPAPSKRKIR